jgi:hypothetical protein
LFELDDVMAGIRIQCKQNLPADHDLETREVVRNRAENPLEGTSRLYTVGPAGHMDPAFLLLA